VLLKDMLMDIMDNQEIQPSNQNNQEPLPQQSSSLPPAPLQPSQPAAAAGQQPDTFSNPAQVVNSQPQQTTALNSMPGKKRSPLGIIIIALVILFVLAAGGYLLITHNNKAAKLTYNHTVKGSQPSTGTTTSTTSDIAGEKDIPFGTTATDGTFQVKLLSTTLTPTVTGNQPDSGTQYLEADFSVTSVANKNNYAFNMFYLPSIVPSGDKMGNIELSPIDKTSGTTSPVTFNHIAAKDVQVTGKSSKEGYTIPTDGTAKTVTVYALFEIKTGDKGQIVWQGLDGGNYHFLTK
jgi:hypothetical protein